VRRASLVGPLLLIAAGALLLARNLYPDLQIGEYIARYWPYVLILWGSLRLTEILYWASTAQPLPRRGVSGGEWILIAFLCMFGTGFHVPRDTVRWWPERIPWQGVQAIGERYDYPVNAEKPASKMPRIVIEDFRGDLQITGSDVDAVKVTGRKSIRSLDKDAADKADRGSSFEISGDADRMTLRLHEPNGFSPQVSVSLEMTVPKGASVEASLGKDRRRDGDLRIAGLEGSVSVSGNAVNLTVQDVHGQVTVDGAYTGEVHLQKLTSGVHFKSQRTDFTTSAVPGEIHMDAGSLSAEGLTGPTHLTSRSRDVRMRDFRDAMDIDLERGDLTLEPLQTPLARIQARLSSGDVSLLMPESAGFSVKANTEHGEITNGLGAGFKVDSDGQKETLNGATGTGPQISIDVKRGSISVNKSSAAPAAKATSHPLETITQ
jgi:Putative adhesin